jgi:hypothetical protein
MTETMNRYRKGKSAINITWVYSRRFLPLQFNYGLNKSNGDIDLKNETYGSTFGKVPGCNMPVPIISYFSQS